MACFHHENTRWRQPILSWNVSRGTQHDIKLTQTEPPIGTSTRWVYDISSIRTYTVRTQSLRNSVVTRYTHVHRCVMQSTWKVRNGEAWSAVETTPCCPPPIPACSQSANKVNRSGADVQVISCIVCYLVIFHPFVEQLTVFHTEGYIWIRSGVLLDLHVTSIAMASWAARAKEVRKLV